VAETLLIPLTKLAIGLVTQPTPGNFNGHSPNKSVPAFSIP
jgi:hypothetical protein